MVVSRLDTPAISLVVDNEDSDSLYVDRLNTPVVELHTPPKHLPKSHTKHKAEHQRDEHAKEKHHAAKQKKEKKLEKPEKEPKHEADKRRLAQSRRSPTSLRKLKTHQQKSHRRLTETLLRLSPTPPSNPLPRRVVQIRRLLRSSRRTRRSLWSARRLQPYHL